MKLSAIVGLGPVSIQLFAKKLAQIKIFSLTIFFVVRSNYKTQFSRNEC
jgi:hypothetical protein